MLDEASEEQTRAEWSARLLDLRMERGIRAIESAAAQFHKRRGRAPSSVAELVRAGDLASVPEEPHGKEYVFVDGKVRSTGGDRPRLRHKEVQR
jgi:hypothetical protein